MINKTEKIYGEPIVESMEKVLKYFEYFNLPPEEIADFIKDFDEITNAGIHLSASYKGKNELADKIDKAMQINLNKRINAFKEAVANGTEQEFLSKMTWVEKSSLKCDMNLGIVRLESKKPNLTKEEKLYSKILQNAIDEDIKAIALSQGFNSVEEWRKHNSEIQCNYSDCRAKRR